MMALSRRALLIVLLTTSLGWPSEGPAGERRLSLEAVLQTVESNHPKLRGAELMRGVASAKVLEKQGAFDPSVGLASSYQRYNSSSSPGKARDYVSLSGTVFRTDPSGVKWEAGYLNNQGAIKSPSSSTGDLGEFYVQAKVPLLRGLNVNQKFVALQQAEIMEKQVGLEYRLLRLLTLLDAGAAYYNWVTAVHQLEVLQENLGLAEVRAEQVRQTIDAGDRPRIDQVEADREVAKRKEGVLKAERSLQKQSFKLALYLWNSEGQAQDVPSPESAPPALPEVPGLDAKTLAQAQVTALESRPELKSLKLQTKIIDLDRELAVNQKLPQLDLALRPGYDAGSQGIGFTMKAGLELVIPLATRAADGRERAAQLKLAKLSLNQVEMVQRILLQVRDAAGELQAAEGRLERALEVYRLARELEDGERLKLEYGDSSLFLVNSRERSTLQAALKVLQIRNEQAQAELLLRGVQGVL